MAVRPTGQNDAVPKTYNPNLPKRLKDLPLKERVYARSAKAFHSIVEFFSKDYYKNKLDRKISALNKHSQEDYEKEINEYTASFTNELRSAAFENYKSQKKPLFEKIEALKNVMDTQDDRQTSELSKTLAEASDPVNKKKACDALIKLPGLIRAEEAWCEEVKLLKAEFPDPLSIRSFNLRLEGLKDALASKNNPSLKLKDFLPDDRKVEFQLIDLLKEWKAEKIKERKSLFDKIKNLPNDQLKLYGYVSKEVHNLDIKAKSQEIEAADTDQLDKDFKSFVYAKVQSEFSSSNQAFLDDKEDYMEAFIAEKDLYKEQIEGLAERIANGSEKNRKARQKSLENLESNISFLDSQITRIEWSYEIIEKAYEEIEDRLKKNDELTILDLVALQEKISLAKQSLPQIKPLIVSDLILLTIEKDRVPTSLVEHWEFQQHIGSIKAKLRSLPESFLGYGKINKRLIKLEDFEAGVQKKQNEIMKEAEKLRLALKEDDNYLKDLESKLGFKQIKVTPDGNCLFHAFKEGLSHLDGAQAKTKEFRKWKKMDATELRVGLYNYLQKNQEKYLGDFGIYEADYIRGFIEMSEKETEQTLSQIDKTLRYHYTEARDSMKNCDKAFEAFCKNKKGEKNYRALWNNHDITHDSSLKKDPTMEDQDFKDFQDLWQARQDKKDEIFNACYTKERFEEYINAMSSSKAYATLFELRMLTEMTKIPTLLYSSLFKNYKDGVLDNQAINDPFVIRVIRPKNTAHFDYLQATKKEAI